MLSLFVFIPIVAIGSIALQVLLSTKENKWVGFILPAISLVGISCFFAFIIFEDKTILFSTTVDGETVLQTVWQMRSPLANIGRYIYSFILWNIPTYILLAIYFARKCKLNKQLALDKMSVQDL